VTKRCQQILSCYLALCVALASAIGLSPELHVWLEHGGHGQTHTHAGAGGKAHAHTHARPRSQSSSTAFLPASQKAEIFFAEAYRPFTLPGFDLKTVYAGIGRWFAHAWSHATEAPAKDDSDHDHHSLPQLLMAGLIEGACDAPDLICAPPPVASAVTHCKPVGPVSDWNAQTASRAPPQSA